MLYGICMARTRGAWRSQGWRGSMNVVSLDEPACGDPELAGGKAAALSRLAASFQVPPGFCLTTTAFDHALADGLSAGAAEPAIQESSVYGELLAAYRSLSERVG